MSLLSSLKIDKLTTKQIIWISIFFHLLAAIFSQGFHKLDEQTGILRYTALKLGSLSADELTAEYQMQIRPWFQPLIYVIILKPLNFLGLNNPFSMALVLRLFMGSLSLYATYILFTIKDKLSPLTKDGMIYLWLLWVLPFFHVRTTAENFGTLLLIFAISFGLKRNNVVAYFLFYLAFTARYQIVVMILGFFAWQVIKSELTKKDILKIILGTAAGFTITTIIDYWGYGELVLSPWQYYKVNILEGFASSFGEDPWYYYLKKAVIKLLPPGSLLFIGSFFYIWIKKPLSLVSLLTLPFFVVHCLIGHKELRFLFPLLPFLPFAFSYLFNDVKNLKIVRALNILHRIFIPLNIIFLCVASLKPAYSQIGFLKNLYKREVTKLYFLESRPRTFPFYLKNKIDFKKINDDTSLNKSFVFTMSIEQFEIIKSKYENCIPIHGETYFKALRSMPFISPKSKKRSKAFVLWECF